MSMLPLKHDKFKFCHQYHIDHEGNIYDENNDIIETFIDDKGYPAIKLEVCTEGANKKSKIFRVHRLVAETFIIKSDNDHIYQRNKVFNINRDKNDTDVDNLLWCNNNEINAAVIYMNRGIEDCIRFMTKHNMEFNEIFHVLFDTGFENRLFFKNRYIKKLIKKYKYVDE